MTLLAGPIVRRASPQCVFMWCATLGIDRLSAVLYEVPDPTQPRTRTVIGRTRRFESVELGKKRLRLHLLPIEPTDPKQPFPTERVLAYDVLDGATSVLRAVAGLTYTGFDLPWLALRDRGTIDILHGSCRKPHGPGRDAMTRADELLAKVGHDLTKRPTALYLTGDQIYADDVETELARWIAYVGPNTLGLDETLLYPAHAESDAKKDQPSRALRATRKLASEIPVEHRHEVVAGLFTSTEAKNHLLSFADFAAMYVFTWGGWLESTRSIRWAPYDAPEEDRTAAELRQAFTRHIPQARRVLAHLPTYMMADDHEITDDWFINPAWAFRAEHHPFSRQVLLNGLAAFALFQAWGNDPKDGDFAFMKRIASWVSTPNRNLADRLCDELLDRYWGFMTAMRPCALFLDSRSHRMPSSTRAEAPPYLVQGDLLARTLNDYRERLRQPEARDAPPIIIAPAPLIGLIPLDEAQAVYSTFLGPYEKDFESWSASGRGFYAVKTAFASAFPDRTVLVLSGDVHFSYLARESFEVRGGPRTDLIQFTSSALDNSGFPPNVVHGFRKQGLSLVAVLGRQREVGVLLEPEDADYREALHEANEVSEAVQRAVIDQLKYAKPEQRAKRLVDTVHETVGKLIRIARAVAGKRQAGPLEVTLKPGASGQRFAYVQRTKYLESEVHGRREPTISFACSIGRFTIKGSKLTMEIRTTPFEPVGTERWPAEPELRSVEVTWY